MSLDHVTLAGEKGGFGLFVVVVEVGVFGRSFDFEGFGVRRVVGSEGLDDQRVLGLLEVSWGREF